MIEKSPEPHPPESESIIINKGGDPLESREEFQRIMEQRVQILDGDSFSRVSGKGSGLGHFIGAFSTLQKGEKAITDPKIYLNRDDFRVAQEDFTDVMPVVIRHEVFEMWLYAKQGWSLFPSPKHIEEEKRRNIGHGLALLEEYRYAFEIGKAERFLEFIHKWSSRLPDKARQATIAEHEAAYARAKRKLERQAGAEGKGGTQG